MSPIRVGLIGLSTSSNPLAPGMWATMSHLPAIVASPHYKLAALCNSTVQSAEASIAHHNLGPNTKAYGSAEDLAQDPNVDLVVVSVQVGKHYMLTKPALLAGKDVFVEWPLGVNTAEAEELADLAKAKGVKTIMGLQARASPLVAKIKEVLDSGRIGKVMSTTVVAIFSGIPVDKFPADAAYYLDKDSGGNVLTISLGHCKPFHLPFCPRVTHTQRICHLQTQTLVIDTLALLLGEPTSLHSILTTQYPTIALLSSSGTVLNPAHSKSAPDHIALHGTLASGAIISLTYRSTPAGSVDAKGLRWLITGTEGEMEILTPELQWQFGPPGTTVTVKTKEGGAEEIVYEKEGKEEEHVGKVPFPGTNTARLYEAFARGRKEGFADFGDAVVRHGMLEKVVESSRR